MMFEKSITIKISIEQFDKLKNESAEKGIEVSALIRDQIDKIGETQAHIEEKIEFYKYQMNVNIKKLKDIAFVEEEKEVKEVVEKEQKEVQDQVKTISNGVYKKIADIVGNVFVENDKEKRSEKEIEVKDLIKKEMGKIDEIIRENCLEKVIYFVNRFHFKLSKKDINNG